MKKTLSLKTRFAIVMSIGALALVLGMGSISMFFAQRDLLTTLSNEQLGMAARAADGLDADLRFAEESIADSAAATPLDVALDAKAFDRFTALHPLLLRLFEQVMVIDAQGVVMSAYPGQAAARVVGLDLADRPYFQRVLASGKPVVSEPLRAKRTGSPIIDIAAPIVGADGRVAAVLVGVMPLTRRSFLAELTSARIGRTGYFTVMTTSSEPVYLASPDTAQIMQPVSRDRSRAAATLLGATGAGTTLSTLDDGTEALVAYKPLATVNWVVAAVLPRAEAFETIARARERTIAVSIVTALVVLPLVWLFAWILFRPLNTLRTQVEAIARDPTSTALVSVGLHDEVGGVALAFNAMLAGQRASEALRVASDQDRRRLVAILESSDDLVAMADVRGNLTYLNASARALCGVGPDGDVSRIAMRDHLPPWALARLQHEGVRVALRKGIWLGEMAIRDRGGRELPVDLTVIAHRGANGRLEYFSTLIHDTSAAATAAAAMRASEARMLSIADALPVHVSFLDRDYRYRFVNSIYERHFAMEKSRILGRSVAELIGPDAYQTYAPFLARAARGETLMFEVDSRSGVSPAHLLVKLIPQFDDQGAIVGYHFIHQDVTDHKAENQRLSQLARADALTGLMNRAGFEAAIGEAMARSRHHLSAMALFYLDVDRFKSINDRHGHQVGDKLLRGFAARLVRAVRSADIAARLGGDEFVVIAEGVRNVDDVRSIAAKILRAMRTPFDFDGAKLSITASIGVAIYAGAELAVDELIHRADAALYRAKDAGRDCFALDDDLATFGTTTLLSENPEYLV